MNRWLLFALLLPIAATCTLNTLTLGVPWQTFSARAGRKWPTVARFVDRLFSPGHCTRQAAWEDANKGNVWRAWGAEWKAAK